MNNLKQTIISYANLLRDDIIATLELNKNISFNSFDEKIDYNDKIKEINEKYKQAIDKYFKVVMIINNYISKQDSERKKLQIESFNESAKKIQKEISDLMVKFKDNKDKEMNLNYLEYYFGEINTREEMLLYLQKNILKYHISNEINIKMKSSLHKIDRILNEINDIKNPFNLDSKYHNQLLNMKLIDKDEKDKNINSEKMLKDL